MRLIELVSTVTVAAFMVGCGDDGKTTPTIDARVATPDAPAAATTATVNFGPVDDSANQVYAAGDLEWKGNMTYTASTNKIVISGAGWTSNMWAPLYDDGPVPTGHEPPGQTAGHHKWGVQVLVDKPVTGMLSGEYGLNDKSYRLAGGDGWLWPPGPNGTFSVSSTATTVNAPGFTLAKFGTNDLRITIDTTMLATRPATDAGVAQVWDTSTVGVKSSAWSWGTTTLTKDGAGKATLTLSSVTGAGKPFPHTGLLASGAKAEFIFVLGTCPPTNTSDCEYKVGGNKAGKAGVTAESKTAAGSFTPLTVQGGDDTTGNTFVVIP